MCYFLFQNDRLLIVFKKSCEAIHFSRGIIIVYRVLIIVHAQNENSWPIQETKNTREEIVIRKRSHPALGASLSQPHAAAGQVLVCVVLS